MRVLVTIDHPWKQSFNYGLLCAALNGLRAARHEIDVLDLHDEDFNPVMSTAELAVYSKGGSLDPKVPYYQQRIKAADYLFYIFPVWWEVMPAHLKGFFDKVFLPEWAFRESDFSPLLTHIRGATAITTMGAPKPVYTSVEAVLCKGILEACGVQKTQWINFCEVQLSSEEQRAAWLAQVEDHARTIQ